MVRPYDFLQSFVDAHLKSNLDPGIELDHWLTHGCVFRTPSAFMLGGDDPDESQDQDTWFVYWAEVHPDLKGDRFAALRFFLDWMPSYRKNIRFNRGVRGNFDSKLYSTDRLLQIIGSRHIQP